MNNYLVNIRKAQVMSIIVAVSFLMIHVGLLLMFRKYDVTPMYYFNIASVIFYAMMIPVILKKWLRFFVVAMDIEIIMHMTAAIICTGWNGGFQITLVAISVLIFLIEYLLRTLELEYVHSILLCILGAVSYVASYLFIHKYPAPYSLPPEVEFRLQLTWAGIVFFTTIGFLQVFLELTFRGEKYLAHRAVRDELTGLPNRYYIMDRLKQIRKSEGLDGYFVAMLDIDDFKKINDGYGHNFGDYVLKTLAAILENNSFGATPCRWGGEEFLIVGRTANSSMAEQCDLLDGLRNSVKECDFTYNNKTIHATVTIGAAEYEQGKSIEEWIHMADKKLYAGKFSGKNKVVC